MKNDLSGNWYGEHCCIGFHTDLHAIEQDTEIGTHIDDTLGDLLHELGVDFVQTDCKGHPGYLSWFSKLPASSMPPGLKQDALAGWRAQTRRYGLPLHCHYSGIWDMAAWERFPEWRIQPPPASATAADCDPPGETNPRLMVMCPNRGYVDGLMLPQMFELVERYGVDGFWIDGDIWSVQPCYCDRCRELYTAETGKTEMPVSEDDPDWPLLWNFMLRSFYRYVTHYCDELHKRHPGVKICSNWLQTYLNPGKPEVPTDWISGDSAPRNGLDSMRTEARFLETRGKPWDIMLWTNLCCGSYGDPETPPAFVSVEMLKQQVAILLSRGGNFQFCEATSCGLPWIGLQEGGFRDGRMVPWRFRRLKPVVDFARLRQPICKNAESLPQVCVLHSETHFYRHVKGRNLRSGGDPAPVSGAVYLMLENHFHTDIRDEWALLPKLDEYPVVVVPEQDDLSEEMASRLKAYAQEGGTLILTGSGLFDRFGAEFLGAESVLVEAKARYFVPDGSDGTVPLYSSAWRLLRPTTASELAPLFTRWGIGGDENGFPAAVCNRVGDGKVIYVPCEVARTYYRNRLPAIRNFWKRILREAAVESLVELDAPDWVDLTLRRSGEQLQIHLINLSSTGIPNELGTTLEMTPTGTITFRLKIARRPQSVRGAWEHPEELKWSWKDGVLTGVLPQLRLYEAILID